MSASARHIAASAVAASFLILALPASAADLYEPRTGSAYDDPRYADIYGEDPPAYDRYRDPRDDFGPVYPPRPVYKHRFYRDFERDRYAEGPACVPRRLARERLRDDGWGDFRNLELRRNFVLLQARRPSGRLFDLTIDRCTGEIVEARPLSSGRSYAYGSRRYWPRSY